MKKRGSRYLRYALYNAAIYVCHWDKIFSAHLQKKRAEGNHYYVEISHAIKKLVRVIYRLQLTGEPYRTAVYAFHYQTFFRAAKGVLFLLCRFF